MVRFVTPNTELKSLDFFLPVRVSRRDRRHVAFFTFEMAFSILPEGIQVNRSESTVNRAATFRRDFPWLSLIIFGTWNKDNGVDKTHPERERTQRVPAPRLLDDISNICPKHA